MYTGHVVVHVCYSYVYLNPGHSCEGLTQETWTEVLQKERRGSRSEGLVYWYCLNAGHWRQDQD